ncbi:MAG: DegV family protein [Acetatifactor sp.]|nr:DegV family protein [Acetatifactor sp.]
MSYKIVVDSCCELPEDLRNDKRLQTVPLELEVGDYRILDDENFNQKDFLQKVAEYSGCPKSACPSPERFLAAYGGDVERVYAITLSSQLSGSYNSAMLAKKLYREEDREKQIHVFDSESASGGETQIVLKIMELEEKGLLFEDIVERVERFRSSVRTYFVLDNLETLRKNGRLSGIKALVASTLNIKPIMAGCKGKILQKAQCIGMKKALARLGEMLAAELQDAKDRCLIISHCNAPERAEFIKKLILAKTQFKRVIILNTKGISSMYANDGGVIVTA